MTDKPCKLEEPNCHGCKHYRFAECPFFPEEATLEGSACIRHPRAREYLMRDVIDELERRTNADRTAYTPANVRKSALEEAIALIKEGVRK